MDDHIRELKKRYNYKKFEVKEPILDIGGGNGDFLISQGITKATIMDLTKNKNPSFNYISADITKKLPKINKNFNTIFLTETLEHLENPLYLLSQVYDLLDKNGICYISIPYTKISPNYHHVCRWKEKEIIDQTKKIGFIPKIIQKRKRFYGLGFFLPSCWLVLSLKKKDINPNRSNIKEYDLDIK